MAISPKADKEVPMFDIYQIMLTPNRRNLHGKIRMELGGIATIRLERLAHNPNLFELIRSNLKR